MARKPIDRRTELSKDDDIAEKLRKSYEGLEKGFLEATDRINDNLDFWDMFNCDLGPNQFYNGTSQAYVPIVHDAVEARKTRFVNQVFPQTGRYVEVTTDDEALPEALMALINHYVEYARLRVDVLPALFKSGDIEGQWSLYVDWSERKRYVTSRVQKGPQIAEGLEIPAEAVDEDDMIEDVE